MWSDNDIDNAFQRLNPPDPEPAPFPLDAWLRLETQLDKAVIERAVRQKMWRFFAAEIVAVALVALGWLLWPTAPASLAAPAGPVAVARSAGKSAASAAGVTSGPANAAGRPAATKTAAGAAAAKVSSVASATAPPALAAGPASAAQPATAGLPASRGLAAPQTPPFLAVLTPAAQRKQAHYDRKTAQNRVAAHKMPAGLAANFASPASRGALRQAEKKAAYPARKAGISAPAASSRAHAGMARLAAAPSAAVGEAAATSARRIPTRQAENGLAQVTARHRHNGQTHQKLRAARALTTASVASNKANTTAARRMVYGSSGSPLFGRGAAPEGSREAPRPRRVPQLENRTTPDVSTRAAASAATGQKAADNEAAENAAESPAVSADFAALALRPVTVLPAEALALPTPLATVAVAPAEIVLPAPERQQPRFYLGLVGAPDVTTVKFASVESPLPNVGITLEYRLTNRLRVSTGLLRSKKQYIARRDDYNWGLYHSLVYQHNFKDVDGMCTVLDIPLNLRYDLVSRPRYKVFGSAGLSSFFMQHERYSYDYQENGINKLWAIDATNANRHLLSILNLSFGYERTLSSRWSVQAEPYLKIPLNGVGAGKVRLISAGVFLGVKYGF